MSRRVPVAPADRRKPPVPGDKGGILATGLHQSHSRTVALCQRSLIFSLFISVPRPAELWRRCRDHAYVKEPPHSIAAFDPAEELAAWLYDREQFGCDFELARPFGEQPG